MSVRCDVRLMYLALLPPPYAFEEVDGPIVSGTVMRLLDIQALTRTATIEVSYDT